jgi:hypothetical protein
LTRWSDGRYSLPRLPNIIITTIEHEKKILAAYETLREIINSAENPDRNSPDWMSLEMAADMAFDAYLKARRRVQRWSGRSTSL